MLEIETYASKEELYFVFRGRIVLDECERVRQHEMQRIVKGLEQVVIDLSNVDFIDSAGLGLLVGFKMAASKNKARIMLSQPSKQVQDLLYVSKLDGIFEVVTGTQAEALRSSMMTPDRRDGGAPAVGTSSSPSLVMGDNITAAGVSGDWIGSKLDSAFADVTNAGGRPGEVPASRSRAQRDQIEDLCKKAVEHMRNGNYEASIAEYQRALELDPDYLPALNNIAIVYEKQPSWAPKAIEVWQRVLQISESRGDQKHIDRAQRHLASLRKMQR